jgi:hypothetical protein
VEDRRFIISVAWAGEAESMAIDDPKGAFQQQYMRKEEKSPLGLAIFAGKLAFPKAGLPLEIFRKVADRFTRASVEERLEAMWKMLVMETEHLL